MNVLPDPEHFVDGIQSVYFEFVIRVASRDEDLDLVLLPDLRITFRHRAPDVRLLDPEAEVQMLVIPQHRDARIEPGRLAGHDIDERRALRGHPPTRLVEPAVDYDRSRGAI